MREATFCHEFPFTSFWTKDHEKSFLFYPERCHENFHNGLQRQGSFVKSPTLFAKKCYIPYAVEQEDMESL